MHPLSILNPTPKKRLLTYVASWFSLFLSSSLQVSVQLSLDQSLYAFNDLTWREVQVKERARETNLSSGRMMLRAKPYSVVRIDLPSSLGAMEPAIIVISSDEEDMDPGPQGPPPHLDVAALHLWWQVFNAASRLHETPSINRRRRRRLLVAFRAYMRELDVLMREVIVAD